MFYINYYGSDICIFFVRMRRILLTLDTIDTLSLYIQIAETRKNNIYFRYTFADYKLS